MTSAFAGNIAAMVKVPSGVQLLVRKLVEQSRWAAELF
jgi:hypothetical protein